MGDVGRFTYNVARRSQKGGTSIGAGGRSATDTYTVVIPSGKHPDEVTITGLPQIHDEWDINDDWYCDQITWSNTFPSETWTAKVRYKKSTSVVQPSGAGGGVYTSVEYQVNSWSVDLERDAGNGLAVMNTAEDRFQDAITTEIYTPTIVIKSKEPHAPVSKITNYLGTINASDITVAGIEIGRHCGLITIAATQGTDPDYPWDCTYTVKICKNPMPDGKLVDWRAASSTDIDTSEDAGYDAVVLNVGRNYLGTPEGAEPSVVHRLRFMDEKPDGEKVEAFDPQMLDEIGDKAGVDPNTGKITQYWLRWQRYPESSWSGLDLPTEPFGGAD